MTWVKICGLTTRDAVQAAVDGGADAVGLVLAPGSPRMLTLDRAQELASNTAIATFIVTVDLSPEEALAAAEAVGAAGIQAHGDRSLDVAAEAIEAGYLSIAPIPIGQHGPTSELHEVPDASLPLFDASCAAHHGGTGITFDWSLISDQGRPYILAGGLGPDNVQEAIDTLHPFGVDASSRLESEPGVKDLTSIVDFIERAKRA
ncbi:MAG: phosphoribosylanthranilate isomerase [Acidimicrobiia bacterium]|nr:MAG: phosphoribosylanthranilate isomerase [Acidimicrobiia bacterium]